MGTLLIIVFVKHKFIVCFIKVEVLPVKFKLQQRLQLERFKHVTKIQCETPSSFIEKLKLNHDKIKTGRAYSGE